ncbi:hypothetical protein SMICM304S_05900 [Streptomyces microflavus]
MEKARWNPGGRLRRTGPKPPPYAEDMRWGRVCTRVLAITRTLGGIGDDPEIAQPPPDFFHQLSDVLGRTVRICALEAELLTSSAPDTLRDDREAASREAWAGLDSLTDTFHRLGRNGGGRRRGAASRDTTTGHRARFHLSEHHRVRRISRPRTRKGG